MNRRHFISTLIGASAGLALEEAIPFNRVWFFPRKIRLASLRVPMYRGFPPGYHEAFGEPGEIFEIVSVNVVNPMFRVPQEWPYGLRPWTLDDITRQIVRKRERTLEFDRSPIPEAQFAS